MARWPGGIPFGGSTLAVTLTILASTPAFAADELAPRIIHEPCEQLSRTADNFIIRALLQDASRLFDPKVIYRLPDRAAHWRQVPLRREDVGGGFVAVIELGGTTGPLEYFIEVFDEHGNGPARIGIPAYPSG